MYKSVEENNMPFHDRRSQTRHHPMVSASKPTYAGPEISAGPEGSDSQTLRDLEIGVCNNTSFHWHTNNIKNTNERKDGH